MSYFFVVGSQQGDLLRLVVKLASNLRELVGKVPILVGEVPILVGEVPILVGEVPVRGPKFITL